MPTGYRPPWLDRYIEKKDPRDPRQYAGRKYVPPKPAPKPFVPSHLVGSPANPAQTPGYPGGLRTPDLGAPMFSSSAPTATPAAAAAEAARIKAAWLKKKAGGSGTGAGVIPSIPITVGSGMSMPVAMPPTLDRLPPATPGLYDVIGTDTRRTYGLGTALQQKILAYKDAMQAPSDRYFGPRPDPYSDDVPRLYDYSQQGEKFGSFADYQKAVEARQHGFVPNDYADLTSGLGADEDGSGDGSGVAGGGGGYPYYPGSQAKAGYNPGARPNWRLWATAIQETTWNI